MTLMLAELGHLLCTRQYGKGSQISNIFPFLFANKCWFTGFELTNANRNSKQKTLISLHLGLHCFSRHFGRQLTFDILGGLLYRVLKATCITIYPVDQDTL